MKDIIKVFLLIAFLTPLHSKTLLAKYSIEYGIFGEVAHVDALLTTKKKTYSIDANLSITSIIASMATNGLQERHISKGKVWNGYLIPSMYQMIKQFGVYNSTTIYTINHKTKKIHRRYKKWKSGKLIVNRVSKLRYYAKDDLVTFFLNLHRHIKYKTKPKRLTFKVAGADRKNGRVDVEIKTKNERDKLNSIMDVKNSDWLSSVIMYRKLYGSSRGELLVNIAKDGMLKKAVLKDVIFFGDVRIILKKRE